MLTISTQLQLKTPTEFNLLIKDYYLKITPSKPNFIGISKVSSIKLPQQCANYIYAYDIFYYDCLNINYYNINYYNIKNTKLFYKYILFSMSLYWTKIAFRGKGFRVIKYKKSRKMTFNFGKSHWTKIIFLHSLWKIIKIKRQLYVIFTYYKDQFLNLKNIFKKIKKINKYTKRGLRLKKQVVIKRFGKISQVVSSLQA